MVRVVKASSGQILRLRNDAIVRQIIRGESELFLRPTFPTLNFCYKVNDHA